MVFSQSADSTKTVVTGATSVTNNGISLVPAFSLGDPAVIFDVGIRRNRFSFEPQLAFSIKDAKPWYFVFWLRYKLLESQKFNMRVGFHPGFLFSTTNIPVNGVDKEYFTTSRFFVGELAPSYSLTKNISIGAYYQYSRGYNSDLKQSNFLGLNMNFSDISLGDQFYMQILPQIYYLKNDDKDGVYVSSDIKLAKRNFPLSISSLLNQKIRSEIPSDNFLWNITLTYTF